MRKFIYPILIIGIVAGLYFGERYIDAQPVQSQSNEVAENIFIEETLYGEKFYPKAGSNQIIRHNYYTLSYNPKYKQAEWVAYSLHPKHLSSNSFKRPYFEIDNKVNGGSAHWRNYKDSQYDRGHLCPAGDRRFSFEAYKETFLTSNASPQNPGFNSGIWNRLEIKVRDWASKKGELFIITGGVLKDGLPAIGMDQISIPEYFYKIIVAHENEVYKSIGFLIPNQNTSNSIATFVTQISEIEKLTGLQFFSQCSQQEEAQIKMPADFLFWQLK